MPSVPSSPVTPSRTHYHRVSHSDAFSSSASSNPYPSNGTRSSRRSSRTSQNSISCSPITPRQTLDRRKSNSMSIGSDGLHDGSRPEEGMENLADELADSWDEYEEGGDDADAAFLDGLREAQSPSTPSRTSTFDDTWPSPTRSNGRISSPTKSHARGNSQHGLSLSDLKVEVDDADGFPVSLTRVIADLEALAGQCLDVDSVSEGGGVIVRTMVALQDLGPQATVEAGSTRITTAYTSVANHRMQAARQILSTAQSVLLRTIFTISEEQHDGLLDGIDQLSQVLQMPPGPSPLQSLQGLMGSTSDLIRSLQSIADNIQESRQVATAASRRLKAVRDLVAELRQEDDLCEQGVQYLERGDWSHRIRSQQAASSCREIVDGFETTCDTWRDRMLGTMSAAEATLA